MKSVLKISCENEGRFLVEFPTKKDALAWVSKERKQKEKETISKKKIDCFFFFFFLIGPSICIYGKEI